MSSEIWSSRGETEGRMLLYKLCVLVHVALRPSSLSVLVLISVEDYHR